MPRNAGDYVKSWGAALIRGAASNPEFTVFIISKMLNVNAFVLLCLELNSRRVDSAETNNFIVWPNDDIRTVIMSTENYGLAVACFQVYYASYGITKYTQCNISHAYIRVIFTSMS